ncbi:MAG TPA: response regulator, partial [Anaerolineae bacterium]|nr:response regulator [Anaerolineae bacterium]
MKSLSDRRGGDSSWLVSHSTGSGALGTGGAEMSKPKVLIIDDDDTYRSVINDVLTESGYLVIEARSGMEGLEQARQADPDVILLDIMMPMMDGYQTCRELRHNPTTREIPIIMLTALTDSEA